MHFPVMEEKDFRSTVIDSNILTETEVKELMKNFNGSLSKSAGFPEDRRVGFSWSCCRFTWFWPCYCDPEDEWFDLTDPPSLDAIVLQVDKDIMLHGIRFLGCLHNRDYLISLKIMDVENHTNLVVLKDESFRSVPLPCREEEVDVYDVIFDPVFLRKNADYVVRSLRRGPGTCIGLGGVNTMQSLGVTFSFKGYRSKSRQNVSAVRFGQFACFFFKPL